MEGVLLLVRGKAQPKTHFGDVIAQPYASLPLVSGLRNPSLGQVGRLQDLLARLTTNLEREVAGHGLHFGIDLNKWKPNQTRCRFGVVWSQRASSVNGPLLSPPLPAPVVQRNAR
jgi:hypothetical protein